MLHILFRFPVKSPNGPMDDPFGEPEHFNFSIFAIAWETTSLLDSFERSQYILLLRRKTYLQDNISCYPFRGFKSKRK